MTSAWPICELEFVQQETGNRAQILMGAPLEEGDGVWGWGWGCRTEIVPFDGGNPVTAMGANPFQAMIQAMARFRLVLSAQSPPYAAASGSVDVVFPRQIPVYYGSEVYEKLCALIDHEVQIIEDKLSSGRKNLEGRRDT